MIVRAATPDDATALARLLTQLGYPASPGDVLPRLERLEAAGDELFVAEVDGDVVGLANLHVAPSVEYDAPAGKLGALVVDERHRGSAVGRALVGAVEERARGRGCTLLFLTTAEHRTGAHVFYERLGFERTGRRYVKLFG